jgi:hypothetical protein
MQPLGACLLLQPFATRNLKTSYPHTSATRELMLLYCASSARTSFLRVANILTSVDAVLREGITQKRPVPADTCRPISSPGSGQLALLAGTSNSAQDFKHFKLN